MNKQAFSLVELSIVLVILGLLSGGILTGQNLIRAAELRDIGTQISKFQTTAYTFREKYFYLPGDLSNATDFWGAADSSGTGGECGSPTTDAGTGTQTCNGDGDGSVNGPGFYERFRYWQHLANAGMIEGTYTGVYSGADHKYATPGENVPRLRIEGGNACAYIGAGDPVAGMFPNTLGYQILILGPTLAGAPCANSFLTPEEAWNVDTKLDDGKPGRGKIQNGTATARPNCSSNDDEDTAEYVLTEKSKTCGMGVKLWPGGT